MDLWAVIKITALIFFSSSITSFLCTFYKVFKVGKGTYTKTTLLPFLFPLEISGNSLTLTNWKCFKSALSSYELFSISAKAFPSWVSMGVNAFSLLTNLAVAILCFILLNIYFFVLKFEQRNCSFFFVFLLASLSKRFARDSRWRGEDLLAIELRRRQVEIVII